MVMEVMFTVSRVLLEAAAFGGQLQCFAGTTALDGIGRAIPGRRHT